MSIQKFQDIVAWQKAQDLAYGVYMQFRELNDYGFRDQIQRASVSVSNNIAEGFNRQSNKEFIRFLYISNGSNSEVQSMVYLAIRLEYIDQLRGEKILHQTNEIGKIIFGLIKSMR